jgi:hypothetical protein
MPGGTASANAAGRQNTRITVCTHDHDHPSSVVPTEAVPTLDRRGALKRIGQLAAGAALLATGAAQAQMHGTPPTGGMPMTPPAGGMPMTHGAMATTPAGEKAPPAHGGSGHPAAHAIPWEAGTCAFCDMTIATPEGFMRGPGFRERTYAQWAFEGEARHFESIGCAISWAYAHGVLDGAGAALYVAPYGLGSTPSETDLIAGADATFLWAERLPASMMAKLGAFGSFNDAAAFAAGYADPAGLGRRRFVDLGLLADMAPAHVNNLPTLLARATGLI